MLRTKSRIPALIVTLAVSLVVMSMAIVPFASAKTGTYSFTVPQMTDDPGNSVRVIARAADGSAYDKTFNVANLTADQARAMIRKDMTNNGWDISENEITLPNRSAADAVIPTLSEWGMIFFVVLLAGWMAFVVVRRSRRSHATAA